MTSEQLEKIAWLNRAFYTEKKLKALKLHCEHDQQRIQTVSVSYGNEKGKSDYRVNGIENAFINLAHSKEKYCLALFEYINLRKEIRSAIENLHDPELEAIFIYRYLEYMSMEKIAETMHYAKITIQRKHNKGIQKMILNDIE